MKLLSLSIENFKNIKVANLDLNKKVILIQGENGQGKSSIIDAIKYILTDELDDKISEYVRWGCKKFNINCVFEHKGITYDLSIEGDKGSKKVLKISNDENEYYNSEATNKLAEIIDFTLAGYSAISEQGKTTQLLFQKPSERLRTLKKILKVDDLQVVVEKIKEDIKTKKTEIDILNTEINTLKGISYDKMEEFELPDIEKIKSEFDVIEKEKKEYEDKEKGNSLEIEKLKNKISEIKLSYEKEKSNELSSLKEQIVKLTSVKDLNEKLISNKKVIEDRISSQTVTKSNLEVQVIDLKNSRVDEIIPSASKEQVVELSDEIKKLTFEISSLDKEIKSLKDRKCPYNFNCEKLKDVSVETYEKEKEDKQKEVIRLQGILEVKSKQWVDYEKAVKVNKELESTLSLMIKDIETLDKSIFELNETHSNIVIQTEDFDKTITDLKYQIVTIEDTYSQKIESEISDVKKEIDNRSVRSEFSKKSEYESLKNQIIIYDTKVKELERIKTHNAELETKQNLNNRYIRTKENTVDAIRNRLVVLDKTKDVIDKDFSSYIISKGAEVIKTKMNNFFQRAYGRYFITFEQDKSSIDFYYSDGENKLTSTLLASGHEKSVLAMANRLALCSLHDLGILICDEIDNMASDDMSVKLYNTLLNEEHINQFIVISHCELTKEMLSLRNDCSTFIINSGEVSN